MAEEGDNGEYFNPEEEVQINPTNNLNLAKVEVKTGEEDEDLIFKSRGKLFRFRDGEWKERGTGDLKLLRHKTEKKIRFIFRQDKTLKIVANFIISEKPLCELKPHQGSDKMFMFMAYDCSDEEPCLEKLPCGHLCAGTCGRCLQGTLHIRCHQKCLNTLKDALQSLNHM